MTNEILFMWAAVTFYVAGTLLFVIGLVFKREKVTRLALLASAAGLLPHLVAVGIRWFRVGHWPYMGFYEVVSKQTFIVIAVFVLAAWRYRRIAPAGAFVMPVAMLMIAAAMLAPKGGLAVTPALASYWLILHVLLANIAFGCLVISFALAVVYVIRARSAPDGPWTRRLEKLPAQDIVDNLIFRFIEAGFLLWGVMVAAGAIWANEAWGRYWGWDSVETWSLVVWLIYAVYLHLRLIMGWRGEKIAWVAVGAMPVAMFSLIGIPFIFPSIHAAYIKGRA